MPNCKLTGNLGGQICAYAVAGAYDLFLLNWLPAAFGADEGDRPPGHLFYQVDENGAIIEIFGSEEGENIAYKIGAADSTISFTDTVLAGAQGGKYRQHTVNAVITANDIATLGGADAVSLGKFVAIIRAKDGTTNFLGITNGLTAPAGGFDYNSGAADADAKGWTLILQGVSTEVHRLAQEGYEPYTGE